MKYPAKLLRISFLILCLTIMVLSSRLSQAQVQIQNKYLANPELNIELADTMANFWFDSFDEQEGAFYTNVARNGEPSDDEMQMITQSQNAYSMARAFQLTGDTTYLEYGSRALEWMYENTWDTAYGGWLKGSDTKSAFDHHYAHIGPAAMFEAGNDSLDWKWLLKAHEADQNLWDDRPDYYGYYDEAGLDWTDPSGKTFGSTVDAITTHALYMYLMTKDDQYKERLIKLGDNIVDYLVPSMDEMDFGFNEIYDSDWGWNPDGAWWNGGGGRFDFTGHITKSAWCLARIYQVEPKPEYLEAAQKIMDDVLAKQDQYHNKITQWWEYEEAFTSGIMTYYLTGNEAYLEYADEQLEYFYETHWDPEYFEFYFNENDDHKGSYYKTSYHSVELAFYTYLYGNLYLYDEPVSLYYKFNAVDTEREISLYPLAIRDDLLAIRNVSLDGEPFTNFDGATRTITLAAGEEGIFKVTFEATGQPVSIEEEHLVEGPRGFSLSQNYPNPFNPVTHIQFKTEQASRVKLIVYDVLGKEVAKLADGYMGQGVHTAVFDATNLPSGVYIYRLSVGNKSQVRKMMLIK